MLFSCIYEHYSFPSISLSMLNFNTVNPHFICSLFFIYPSYSVFVGSLSTICFLSPPFFISLSYILTYFSLYSSVSPIIFLTNIFMVLHQTPLFSIFPKQIIPLFRSYTPIFPNFLPLHTPAPTIPSNCSVPHSHSFYQRFLPLTAPTLLRKWFMDLSGNHLIPSFFVIFSTPFTTPSSANGSPAFLLTVPSPLLTFSLIQFTTTGLHWFTEYRLNQPPSLSPSHSIPHLYH